MIILIEDNFMKHKYTVLLFKNCNAMCHGNEISICICSLKVISETLNETLWTMVAENITKLCLVKSSKL